MAGFYWRTQMELLLDSDIKAVLEFMKSNIKADKLMNVAENIPRFAAILWEHHRREEERLIPAFLQTPKTP
jgi:hypothetical protein